MRKIVRVGSSLLFLAALLCGIGWVAATAAAGGPAPAADASALMVPGGGHPASVDPALVRAKGEVDVVVRLIDAPLAVAHGRNAKQQGGALNPGQQRAYLKELAQKQDGLMGQVRGLGGRELGRVSKALNAVIVRVDASRIPDIAALPGVEGIRPVIDYQLDLSDTVPYIGASAVQAAGFNGTGIRVAVLDSGIDYTHAFLGGAGTAAAYTAAYGTTTSDARNTTTDGLFPTAKVVGGFDFVGEVWPTPNAALCGLDASGNPRTCLLPDPDPIDCGPAAIPAPCAGSHGTHVSDIIAGNDGGSHKGVAPGASLYAVKICSSVSNSCSGVGLLEGMDFALDPNGDGDISDAVDVVNMSLGSAYGQKEDDLSAASANAVNLGIIVVAAAGNNADRPYITSSPASTPEVISAAQTQVPSATVYPLVINSPASIAGTYANASTVDWAPIGAGFTSKEVAFVGRGCPGDPYLADPAGKVALIDRGVCAVSLKVNRAAHAGAVGVLIGLVAAGDAISFSFGGGDMFVPTLVITQSTSNLIKANLAAPVVVTVSPAFTVPLVGSMVSSSARGPSISYQAVKPDIGAPGASVSAVAGSGTGQEAFGGTSGATPMIAGSAALLLNAYPSRTPAEIKSLLMNTAETNITTNPALQPGVLAPISRIGGGEVRVDRALNSTTAAWDDDDNTGSLSFGYSAVASPTTLNKTVRVRNYGATARTYSITPSFRYADDAASGAVTLTAPGSIVVAGNGSATFRVRLKIDPTKLPVWTLNGGARGGDGFRLQGVEFDGYIGIADATDNIHVAWHVLPHRAADVSPASTSVTLSGGAGTLSLSNAGTIGGRADVFSLMGTSGKIPKKFLPNPGDNFAVVDLRAVGTRLVGIGGGNFGVQFAVNTFGARPHPNYPAEFDIYIDKNRDGVFDFVVFNLENGAFGSTGQNVDAVFNLATGTASIFFFTDADLDSANAILTAPLAAMGMTPSTQFDFSVFAFDNYFTGALTDSIEGMTATLDTPRFVGSGIPATGVPAGGSSTLTINAIPGGDVASPSQSGLLLMYRDSKGQQEASPILVF
ncbi:MAG TPA: S8 family serine peptidase [Candidatus Dormibacteraeota bacterium]|nr:S8 family serine peptidase [Candidatus Dormibacteraeota bacterium]